MWLGKEEQMLGGLGIRNLPVFECPGPYRKASVSVMAGVFSVPGRILIRVCVVDSCSPNHLFLKEDLMSQPMIEGLGIKGEYNQAE